jgi:hypothetical protein
MSARWLDATVYYSAYVSYDDPGSLIVDSSENVFAYMRKKKGTVNDSTEMSGATKLRFDSSWQHIEDVVSTSFDYDDVCVVESPPVEDETEDWDIR